MAAHNRVLGRLRTSVVQARNTLVLAQLRAHVAAQPGPLPTDRAGLYAIVGTHGGRLPWTALRQLARIVRKERA